jgi:WD40 repeat protein
LDEGKSNNCLTFSPDSKLLASKGRNNEGILIWDAKTGRQIASLDEHQEPIGDTSSLHFSPSGKLLASAGYDGQVILWNTRSWKSVKRLLGHGMVRDLTFSPDGKRLVSASDDNWCRLWDVDSALEIGKFPGLALDFSPDGNALAVGGEGILPGARNPSSPRESTIRILRAPIFADLKGAE